MANPFYLRNAGKPLAAKDTAQVRQLAKGNTPTRVIALKIGRSVPSVRAIAASNDISLKPTNQAPYNRRSK
jgi:hypothetical protein